MSVFDKMFGSAAATQAPPEVQHRFEELKQEYQSVLNIIEQQRIRLSHLHVQDNKLFLQGTAPSQEAKNKVWDQIKLVNPKYDDITADISVDQSGAPASAPAAAASATTAGTATYTVQPGDTLSKIALQFYHDANAYMRIFEANKDKLKDPNHIYPGQVLNIPGR